MHGSDSGLDGLGVQDCAVVVGVFIVLVIMEECDGEGEGMSVCCILLSNADAVGPPSFNVLRLFYHNVP